MKNSITNTIKHTENRGRSLSALFLKSIILCLALFSGCKKLVEVDAPKTEIPVNTVFSTDASASLAVVGMYGAILNGSGFGNVGYINSLLADESDPTYAGYYTSQYGTNMMTSSDGYAQSFWTNFYSIIYQANSIIENSKASTGMSDSVKTQYIGEAEFVRSLCNFYLVGLYGPVPLVTTTNVKNNILLSRADTLTVYNQIIADLTDAESRLPSDYNKYNGERARANKYAAAVLLAKAYLNIGKYAEAEQQCTMIINRSDLYSLLPSSNLTAVFLKNSAESIFAINPEQPTGQFVLPDFNYYAYSLQYGALYGPSYVLTSALANAFEPGDLRKTQWVNSFVYQGATYYYGAKYTDYNSSDSPSQYDIVFRLSEVYLIRAEANAKQNNLSQAGIDLNVVRIRAGLANTAAITQADLLTAIYHERQVELFLEFGNRWLDLVRTGKANSVLGALKPATWKPTDVLYPIPVGEIKTDPRLTQNPGY